MYKYIHKPTRIGGLISEGVLLNRSKVRLHLANKNENEMISNLKNVYYLYSSLLNIVSLILLNDYEI